MSDQKVPYLFRPWLDYVWNAPFWMRAVHFPVPSASRANKLQSLCEFLNTHPIKGSCIKSWCLEDLTETSEPWRLQLRLQHRLVADLEEDSELVTHVRGVIASAGFEDKIEVIPLSSRLYYEEFSLGAVEYRLFIQLHCEENREKVWDEFLHSHEVWDMMDFTTLLSSSKLQIQLDWPELRERFRSGIDACFGRRFRVLESFLDWKSTSSDQPARQKQQITSSADRVRDDDFLWTQCMDIILYRNPEFTLDKSGLGQATEVVHRLGLGFDYTSDVLIAGSPVDELQTGYSKTATYLLRVYTENCADDHLQNSLDILYSGFGMVALVTEERGRYFYDQKGDASSSPSSSVSALRRRMLINYGALTEAADGLRAYLADILFLPADAVEDRHERLRLIVATLAMVKYDARAEVTESDNMETYVYGAFCQAWGLERQSDVLTALTADADTATSRISEATTHSEERNLGILILVLTIATMGGVLSEVYAFIIESEQPKILNVEPIVLHLVLLFVVLLIPIVIAYWLGIFDSLSARLLKRLPGIVRHSRGE
jgi:hypothetical protein